MKHRMRLVVKYFEINIHPNLSSMEAKFKRNRSNVHKLDKWDFTSLSLHVDLC